MGAALKKSAFNIKKSFTRRVVLVVVFIIGLTLGAVALITDHYTRQELVEQARDAGERSVLADSTSLGTCLSSLRRSAREIYYNGGMYALLFQSELEYQDQQAIFTFLQSLINLSEGGEVRQICMECCTSGTGFLAGSNGRAVGKPVWEFRMPEDRSRYQGICEEPHRLHDYGMLSQTDTEEEVCTFHWNLYSTMGDKIIGRMAIDVAVSGLARFLTAAENGNPVLVLGENGTVIYSNTDLLSEKQREEIWQQREQSRQIDFRGEDFQGIAFVQPVPDSGFGWTVVELKNRRELFAAANRILLYESALMIFAGILCAAVVTIMIYRMMRPLREVHEYVQEVEQGNLTADIRNYSKYSRPDEIGFLIEHLEHMIHTIQDMFIRQQKLSQAHRSVEMKMLLAQINPHFIYNSLQSISTLALVHGDKDVYQLLTKLGAEMQYSMDLERETAELPEELRYTANYLDLQRQRFEQRFSYEIQAAPDTEKISVPRMMVQPLAENAIKHGKIHRRNGGFIRICTQRKDEWLVLTLSDNGEGCPVERREELNRELADLKEQEMGLSAHIGMRNVCWRLRLMYGDKVSMKISESEWRGVQVTVKIPLDQYKEGPKIESPDRR